MTTSNIKQGIYLGSRGDDFLKLLTTIFENSKLKNKIIKILTTPEALEIYSNAFTSTTADQDKNYEVMEQLGDLSGNKFIVSYMYNRFPYLECSEGVKIVARLRINYGAKENFSNIAKNLGFWNFISASNEIRYHKMKPLLEDVFESFLGATERILDRKVKIGVGYANVCYILIGIFDKIPISLKYEDLYDPKTRLKELFDFHGRTLGTLEYKNIKTEFNTTAIVILQLNECKTKIEIGSGTASLKIDSQQLASSKALENLANQGWVKTVSPIYDHFESLSKLHADMKIEEKEILIEDEKVEAVKSKIKNKEILIEDEKSVKSKIKNKEILIEDEKSVKSKIKNKEILIEDEKSVKSKIKNKEILVEDEIKKEKSVKSKIKNKEILVEDEIKIKKVKSVKSRKSPCYENEILVEDEIKIKIKKVKFVKSKIKEKEILVEDEIKLENVKSRKSPCYENEIKLEKVKSRKSPCYENEIKLENVKSRCNLKTQKTFTENESSSSNSISDYKQKKEKN
jgi:dsRNA-specific ribonuclease